MQAGEPGSASGVMVPESLRLTVFRILAAESRRQQLVSGGVAASAELTRFLLALRRVDVAEPEAGSVNGSAPADPGKVLLTTQDIAEQMGCTTRWARTVARRIGTRVGRQWLVDRDTFEHETRTP